jgi:hypothetical protein
MYRRAQTAIVFASAMFATSSAAAQQTQDQPEPEPGPSTAALSAEAGQYLPLTIAPRVDSQRGYVRALGGFDSARRSAQFDARADVTIWGPIAATVGAVYTRKSDFRPTVGARVQALNQSDHFVDMAVGAYYKPEGFDEFEGEVEFVLALGHRFGRLSTFANLVYGQDPEGAERDGELRLAALYELTTPLQVGLDARLRFDLGSEQEKIAKEGGAEYDLVLGPTASYAFGPVAAIAHAGLSLYGTSPARPGAVVLLGMAGSI